MSHVVYLMSPPILGQEGIPYFPTSALKGGEHIRLLQRDATKRSC